MASNEDDKNEGWMDWERNRPFGPIIMSIVVVIAWLVFILLYALYWSTGYSLFQNVIVTVVSLVIAALVLGLGWMVWGMRHAPFWFRRK